MSDRRRELAELRRQLAEADAHIVAMLRQRTRLSRRAGELGEGLSSSPLQGNDQLEAVAGLATEELPAAAIRNVFHEIHAATSDRGAPLTVAYVTPDGGSCQVAAEHQFGPLAQYLRCADTARAMEEVQRRRASAAVFEIESSLEGPRVRAIEALAASELSIVAKIEATSQLHLMSRTGQLNGVERIYAFPSDGAACAVELRAWGSASVVSAASPRVAAELARDDDQAAALVQEATGLAAGLTIARANVRDAPHARVRYAVASVRPAARTGADTTALLAGLKHKTGALVDVLRPFGDREIDVTCVHACPFWDDGWAYRFYLEVAGHVTDRGVITALEAVRREARTLRVLGSFAGGRPLRG